MTEHINHIKTLWEHLEAIDDRRAEKNLVVLLIISLPEEHNYLITALVTIAKDHLTWDYFRDRLIHESQKKKSCEAEKPIDALFVSKPDKKFVKCHHCKLLQEETDLKKKESHAKLASDDENGIGKPEEVALKSSSQVKDADW